MASVLNDDKYSFDEKIEAFYEELEKYREEEDQRIEASGRLDYYRPKNISEAAIKHNRLAKRLLDRKLVVSELLQKKAAEIRRYEQNEPTPITDAYQNKLKTLRAEDMALSVELSAIIKGILKDSAKVTRKAN